jgi:hypothetical protein
MNVISVVCIISKILPLIISCVLQSSHMLATGGSCRRDETFIFRPATDDLCSEETTDTRATHSKSSAKLGTSLTSSSCKITEIKYVESAKKDSLRKEEFEMKGRISGCQNPLAGTAKRTKSREEESTIGFDEGSKRYNLWNSLNIETSQQEIKSRSMPDNLSDNECIFCHSFGTTEVGYIQCFYFLL